MGATDISVVDGLLTTGAEFRAALFALQAGVLGPDDFKVTERALGANRSVDVAPGRAVLTDTSSNADSFPGFMCPNYVVAHNQDVNSSEFELGGITPPHGSFARLDQIIAVLYDNVGGIRRWRLEVLTGGNPSEDATLTNRHNAATIPPGAKIRIADVVVPTDGVITDEHIRDRRPWAKGAFSALVRDSGDLTVTTSLALLTGTQTRLECSGKPIKCTLDTEFTYVEFSQTITFSLYIDGEVAGSRSYAIGSSGAGTDNASISFVVSPSAGSHVFEWRAQMSSGTATVRAGTLPNKLLRTYVEEELRQIVSNA